MPIFIISFNRGQYLSRVISSYRKQDFPVEIVIHDNGSDDPYTLRVLSSFSAKGVKVYRYGPISHPDELNDVNLSVRRYESENGYVGPFAVTDCDIDLSDARPDALRTYLRLLDLFDVECVGPMLTIADIPRSYPLFNRVMERHIEQFWGRTPEWTHLEGTRIAYLRHPIDTTFAVHRSGSTFRRLKSGLRVYHPYEARHLDWYISDDRRTNYHRTSAAEISHWDNEVEFARCSILPDEVRTYMIVEGKCGALRVVERSTLDNPSGQLQAAAWINRLKSKFRLRGVLPYGRGGN